MTPERGRVLELAARARRTPSEEAELWDGQRRPDSGLDRAEYSESLDDMNRYQLKAEAIRVWMLLQELRAKVRP